MQMSESNLNIKMSIRQLLKVICVFDIGFSMQIRDAIYIEKIGIM